MISKIFLVSALAVNVLAAPRSNMRVVHERRAIESPNKGDRVSDDAIIPIRIGLKQTNLEHGYDKVMDVSDPSSPNYGKHWTLEEVREFFAPKEESFQAVREWLVESGIASDLIGHSDDKAWIGVNIPVKQAEDLFGAEYHEHDIHDGTARIGCDEYYLPLHISEHVELIKPGVVLSPPLAKTTLTRRDVTDVLNSADAIPTMNAQSPNPNRIDVPYFSPPATRPMPESLTASADDLSNCDMIITPACIKALYDIPKATAHSPENTLGVGEFNPDKYNQQDLNLFFKSFAPYVPAGTHPKLVSVDGGTAPTTLKNAGGESDIDFDIVFSLVYPESVTLYQVGKAPFGGLNREQAMNEVTFLLPLLDAVDGSFCTSADRKAGFDCGTTTLTRVLSVSYGTAELFLYQSAAVRTCNEFMKLSLQGHTIIFSSGDYGVANAPSEKYNGCYNPQFPDQGVSGTVFSPDFPVDCPYILGVGGTQLDPGQTVNDTEHVLDQPTIGVTGVATFSSGGGFSNYFNRPSYQDKAVSTYLANYAPPYPSYVYNGQDPFSGNTNIGENGGLYNRVGRGFPDVSANGANFAAYNQGKETEFYGTSLATPIWASILTLINEERTKEGKPAVGFVNPVLYAHPEAFHDVTVGKNPGCNTEGFPASPGWDPSSGLGTPNFPALLKVFMAGY